MMGPLFLSPKNSCTVCTYVTLCVHSQHRNQDPITIETTLSGPIGGLNSKVLLYTCTYVCNMYIDNQQVYNYPYVHVCMWK